MKKYFIILVVSLLSISTYSQCCPYIESLVIVPAANSDETLAILTVTTPNQGSFLESSFTLDGNNISIFACYYSGFLTALQTYVDTLSLGVLQEGEYNYTFYAYQSESPNICTQIDSQSITGSFEIGVIDNVEENTANYKIKYEVLMYPNPVRRSLLNIDTDAFIEMIEVYETSGKMVKFVMSKNGESIGQITIGDLYNTVYQVVLTTKDGQQLSKQLIIQR